MTNALPTKSVCREKMLAISVRPLASLGHFTAAIFAPSKGPKLLSSQLFLKAVSLSNGSNEEIGERKITGWEPKGCIFHFSS